MGITCPFQARHFFGNIEAKTMGGAYCDTSWHQILINSIHAVIAFDYLPNFRIPLGCAPGTGRDAGFATHTELVIHKDNTIFFTALHGTGGAGRNTPGIFTVKAGHKNERSSGFAVKEFGPNLDDLAGPCFRWK
jgi:hypothetical protein